MDIVVKGRHTAVPERFRKHVQAKLTKLERLDPKAYRVDAELSRERNPRLSGIRERVELTVYSRGPVIRAEAAARDPYAALDAAAAKLNERLRRAADRRCSHHGAHHGNGHGNGNGHGSDPGAGHGVPDTDRRADAATTPQASAEAIATAVKAVSRPDGPVAVVPTPELGRREAGGDENADAYDVPDASPMVVREKTHQAAPMTLDDALSNMELVGHDFYLFVDLPTGLPSVVYRRCGYDYGVIRLGGAGAEYPVAADATAFGARRTASAGRLAGSRP